MTLLGSLTAKERNGILSKYSDAELEALRYDWRAWARPNQLPPEGDWRIWILLAGRGFGKTKSGSEYVRMRVSEGKAMRVGLIAPTPADCRDVMIEGESGILKVSPDWERPSWHPSKRRLTWPNGAIGIVYSSHEPDQLRGPQHDLLWCDELCSWNYARETWDMAMFGLRLGDPRCVITTTPKPLALLKDLLKESHVAVTRGSTYENRANLAPAFFEQIVSKYEGTSLGQQELYAQILDESPGALWNRSILARDRVQGPVQMNRIVVAIDPPAESKEESAEAGIVVAGLGVNGHGYLLADLSSRCSPEQWGRRAVNAYHDWSADRIVAETNNGGEMVAHVIRSVDQKVAFKSVRASRGKATRAEPIAAFYEQGRIHHVGFFEQLEDQLCTWVVGEKSPDRLDALVWAFSELMLGKSFNAHLSFGDGAGESRWRL